MLLDYKLNKLFGQDNMRSVGWETRLNSIIIDASKNAFEWGTQDCALFAANCFLAVTGEDYAVFFRNKYTTEEGAYAALEEFAGAGLEEALDKINETAKFDVVTGNFAQRGDIVLVDISGGKGTYAAGVIDLSGKSVLVVSERGLLSIGRRYIKKAWRIE
jgi:hypothetical protein